ncbi:DUF2007 domain-containing protein [Novosphingopyxis iocasae]|uniref:putative signal transducing protein n=1 Tax=Novosphingopyxis iocasae TaxID=2762729 RepID=UPI00165189B8|nr:DUF2007 domain-containing protein [Novosphingopyxis iocasae]
MGLVRIAQFPDRMAADLARLQLAAEGIESVVFDGGMASLGLGMMTPARLMVAEEDADHARDLLGSAETDEGA